MFGRKKSSSNDVYSRLVKEYEANKPMIASMSADERTAVVFGGYALDAVDLSKQGMNIDLDFSESSISLVESILDALSKDIVKLKPSSENIDLMAKKYAGYIGEVIRQNDGRWRAEENTHAKNAGPAIVFNHNEFYVLNKVAKRLVNGPEDNVWHAYTALRSK